MLAGQTARLGGLAGGGAQEIRKSGEIGLGLQHQHVVALVGEHVLAESGAERREPLADLGKARLGRRRRDARRPGGTVVSIALDARAPALRSERALALAEHLLDPAEQVAVQIDLVVMGGEPAATSPARSPGWHRWYGRPTAQRKHPRRATACRRRAPARRWCCRSSARPGRRGSPRSRHHAPPWPARRRAGIVRARCRRTAAPRIRPARGPGADWTAVSAERIAVRSVRSWC